MNEGRVPVRGLGGMRCGTTDFRWGERTYIMGIVNVTPDSFSGDGLGSDVSAAIAQARRFVEEGADIIDVGGESTRPGSSPVSQQEEITRVLPVIELLAAEMPVPISIDTYKAEVARQAVQAGATIVNDVWGLKRSPEIAEIASASGVSLILMHNQTGAEYADLVTDVKISLRGSMERALDAGVLWEKLILDPGIGFGKTAQHNLELLRRLAELKELGRPILLGTSRKSTVGAVLGLPVDQRLEGTAATVAIGIANGADIVRVHDVATMARVCRMSDAIVRGWNPEGYNSRERPEVP